jgi:hypothetical protein
MIAPIRLVAIAALWAVFSCPALAQHNHSAGHDEYMGWASRKVSNCCNNQDCRGLDDAEVRQTTTGPEVLIDKQWCPVLREHYLTRGKSPDWNVSHACIRLTGQGCDRLLCYSEKGGF